VSSENVLYSFALLFSELVCAGIPLRKSADVLSSQPSVPQWFCAFVLAAEETGCIGPTMKYLSVVLSVRKDAKEKAVTALVYPAFVTVLSFVSSLFCIFMLPGIFFGSDTAAKLSARSTAVRSCILGLVFLLCVSCAFGYAVKKTVTGSPLLRFMQLRRELLLTRLYKNHGVLLHVHRSVRSRQHFSRITQTAECSRRQNRDLRHSGRSLSLFLFRRDGVDRIQTEKVFLIRGELRIAI
jgi:hypothetical protein